VTRREILKYGSIATGAVLVSTKGRLPRAFASGGGAPQGLPLTPFVDPLPRPPTAIATLTQFADLSAAAKVYVDPSGRNLGQARFYSVIAEERTVKFHRDLPPTSIWGYRDQNGPAVTPFALGPTFQERISASQTSGAIVRVTNGLNPNVPSFGSPHLSTHLHGGHQPFFSDGFPTDIASPVFNPVIDPGKFYDYAYPLLDPGFISDVADASDRPATQWYHDHVIDFTGANVYRGLVGLFQVFDPVVNGVAGGPDIGDENNPTGLRLPSGEFDIPLVVQDKVFAPDGSLVFDPFNHDGFLGNQFLMNGKVQPFAEVSRRRYRLRFLNGSGARIYSLFLTNAKGQPQPMSIIATEGGLLSHAQQPVTSFMMAPAERYEVIVDFSKLDGNEFFIENRLSQDEGRGPNGSFENPDILPVGTQIMKFIVGPAVPDPSFDIQPGDALRPFAAITAAQIAAVKTFREFVFERSHGAWVINGTLAGNLSSPMAAPTLNQPEIWTLKNSSGGWWHPIHIHSEFQRVLSRNGVSPSPVVFERDGIARKDTTLLGPNSEVKVYLRFRDYAGPFVFHCHNIAHEDMAMMARFDIMPLAGTPSL
jgi:FtsP/CotA-like multicopper oxidase with cupredoxin domain